MSSEVSRDPSRGYAANNARSPNPKPTTPLTREDRQRSPPRNASPRADASSPSATGGNADAREVRP